MKMPSISFSRRLAAWAFGVALGGFAASGGAAVLYSQAPVGGGVGYYANTNWPQQIADDFALGSAVTLDGISWWGGDDGNASPDDDFLVRIYSSLSGTGTVLHTYAPGAVVTRTAAGLVDGAGNAVYRYDFILAAPEALPAGTYNLFVQNLGQTDWFWLQGSGNAAFAFRGGDSDSWTPIQGQYYDVAFTLNGTTIPEPGTVPLVLLAVGALLLARRRGDKAR